MAKKQKRFETISFICSLILELKLKEQFELKKEISNSNTTNPVRITAPIGINYVESSKHVSSTAIIYAHSTSNVIGNDVNRQCVHVRLIRCMCVCVCFCDTMLANRNRDIARMYASILSLDCPIEIQYKLITILNVPALW